MHVRVLMRVVVMMPTPKPVIVLMACYCSDARSGDDAYYVIMHVRAMVPVIGMMPSLCYDACCCSDGQ